MNQHDESFTLTRRAALRSGSWFALAALTPSLLSNAARAGAAGSGNQVLVHLFLRGGIDGLSVAVPYADGGLYAARPTMALGPPGTVGGVIDLDGFFGLNPAAAPLLPAFAAGDLAVVQAFGSPDPTRSHFLAFQKMEFGIPNQPATSAAEGWLARFLKHTPATTNSPLRCAILREVAPLALAGAPRTLPVSDPAAFAFPGAAATAGSREAALRAMYDQTAAPVGPAAFDTLDTIDLLDAQIFAPPSGGAVYPDTELGKRLANAAALIKLDLGVEVIAVEDDGYDHHSNQGPKDGELALMLDDLARSLAALRTDLASVWSRVTLVAHSEFGRRVAENASKGTDHGHGGIALVMGGHVTAGPVVGNWPGLSQQQWIDGDLAITTDYRDVFGEILAKRLGATKLDLIFPNHVVVPPGYVG
jgi:uncharacterized protein (DUF1501 family)